MRDRTQIRAVSSVAALLVAMALLVPLYACDSGPGGQPPSADFRASTTTGYVPADIQFTDISVGVVNAWEWDFDGDGTVDSTSRNPRYTYDSPGNYTVSLTASGPGGSDTRTREDYLTFTVYPCKASFVAQKPVPVEGGIRVAFRGDQATGATGWNWDFEGDGTIDSIEMNPIHTYPGYGPYTVTLTVTAPHCEDTVTKVNYIEYSPAPEADFSAAPLTGEVPVQVQFTDLSSGEITTREWDFDGDGTVDSNLRNPTHAYSAAGTFTVILEVIGPGGNDREVKAGYLSFSSAPTPTPAPGVCKADFQASPTEGEGRTWVQFVDRSTPTGSITSWEWDLDGDGEVDTTAQNPKFYYRADGEYTVTLTITGTGCTDSVTKVDYISISGCPT